MSLLVTAKPDSGFWYLMGYLRQQGLHVQERCVWKSLHRVDGLNGRLRKSHLIRRWKYTVKQSNSLWHLNGHHKLIRWGFIVHAIIDGYC
ncbi:hypothetical protein PAXINDRAFT_92321 [Paxillus involutus ATCC 200175]|uniref:Integrase core domain-containing protein n=1 Tax=Paxillus involutus ATCC 200175 TaxID=664439 RepID=A0A0C9SMI6_PAXIN|nr:hypothetical protein PAXINDRAFT_92321 [Paxillus involutus ATCC 200175]